MHEGWSDVSKEQSLGTKGMHESAGEVFDEVARKIFDEMVGKVIRTCSASGEVERAIYASCMERVIAWVVGIGSNVWEIENSAEVGGRVSEVQIQRLLRRTLEVVWFCQTLGGQVEAMRKAEERRFCFEALSRCASTPRLASAHPRR